MKRFDNILYIDTRDNRKIVVCLERDGEKFKIESKATKQKAQATLPLIEKALKRVKMSFSDIDEITVEKGPGSFTGLRVGISIANALGFALGKKINRKKLGSIEIPNYK